MALLIGIDEAGYGPTLGPLVAASTVWRIPAADHNVDLWRLLRSCVARSAAKGQWRIVVGDSKQVYDRNKGIGTLERSVQAFLRCCGASCPDLTSLLAWLGTDVSESWGEAPWYRDLSHALPHDPQSAASEAVFQRLADTLAEVGASCVAMRASVVPEHHFNARLSQTNNKAAVLIEQILRLLDRGIRDAGDEPVFVTVDRLGGRDDYRKLLMTAFPDRDLHIVRMDDVVSEYRLAPRQAGPDVCVRFQVEADNECLPVALASMAAKYVRELLMARFNAYWQVIAPGVRPTAGYYNDAQRFLQETSAIAAAARIEMQRFVRQK
ncbi:MAG: hypothetical protein JNG88_11785 [Phycisphaerales bacterium]|nr:hypothetical protein [Phycisphaerales bacterium]